MESIDFAELNTVAILAFVMILVVREVVKLVPTKNGKSTDPATVGIQNAMKHQGELLEDLHQWHNVKGENGVPIWYMRTGLVRCMEQNLELQRQMLEMNRKLVEITTKNGEGIQALVDFVKITEARKGR